MVQPGPPTSVAGRFRRRTFAIPPAPPFPASHSLSFPRPAGRSRPAERDGQRGPAHPAGVRQPVRARAGPGRGPPPRRAPPPRPAAAPPRRAPKGPVGGWRGGVGCHRPGDRPAPAPGAGGDGAGRRPACCPSCWERSTRPGPPCSGRHRTTGFATVSRPRRGRGRPRPGGGPWPPPGRRWCPLARGRCERLGPPGALPPPAPGPEKAAAEAVTPGRGRSRSRGDFVRRSGGRAE